MYKIPKIEPGTLHVIYESGTEEVVKVARRNLHAEMYRIIKPLPPYREPETAKGYLDFVRVGRAEHGTPNEDIVMAVDDNGYTSELRSTPYGVELVTGIPRRPVNQKATELYHRICVPGTTHKILGPVILVHDNAWM